MYTITFYSFKGVGRTLALVNVAAELAMRGRKVLLVDFDLEAPALDMAAKLQPTKPQAGLVEFVTHYANTGQVPAVRDYLYEAGAFGKKGGRIWVMPAGQRDQAYRLALARLDWRSLYLSQDGEAFIDQMKDQWKETLHPDYVLIDCRSGHTNVEGICTRQLPDAVVALFFPDLQNLAGLLRVCRDVRTETERTRPDDPIKLHFVMSNVPVLQEESLSRRRQLAMDKLHIPTLAATLHHDEGLVALDQHVFVMDRPDTRLAQEYRALVDTLIVHNVDDEQGGLLLIDRLERAYARGVVGAEREDEEQRLDDFRERHHDKPEFLMRVARCLMTGNRFADAERVLDKVLEAQPDLPEALLHRARCRELQGMPHEAIEDLHAYVRLPKLEKEQILSALRGLYRLAPEEFEDLRKRDEVQAFVKNPSHGMSEEPEPWYRSLPWDLDRDWRSFWELGVSPAVSPSEEPEPWYRTLSLLDRLRLEVLLRPEVSDVPVGGEMTPLQRLRRKIRDLEEEIRNLEVTWQTQLAEKSRDDGERNRGASELACTYFDLAMIHWVATGHLSEDLCKQGLQYHEQVDANFTTPNGTPRDNPAYCQLLALALWRVGRVKEALSEISRGEATVSSGSEEPYSSPWRGLEEITPEQYLRDFAEIEALVRGNRRIQPARFFGKDVLFQAW